MPKTQKEAKRKRKVWDEERTQTRMQMLLLVVIEPVIVPCEQ
jgi:hypothetical protein